MNKFHQICVLGLLFSLLSGEHQLAIGKGTNNVLGLEGGLFGHKDYGIKISPTAGFFYERKINSRFGLGIGALYRQSYRDGVTYLNLSKYEDNGYYSHVHFTFGYVELPVHLAVNLNKKNNAAWKTNFLVGGTYSYFVGATFRDIDTKSKILYSRNFFLSNHQYYANIGLEVSHIFNNKFLVAFNPGYRYELFEHSRQNNIFLNVKFGRIF